MLYALIAIAAVAVAKIFSRQTPPAHPPSDRAEIDRQLRLNHLQAKMSMRIQEVGTLDARVLSVILIAIGIMQYAHENHLATTIPDILLSVAIVGLLYHLGFSLTPGLNPRKAIQHDTTLSLEEAIAAETNEGTASLDRQILRQSRWTAFAAILTLVAAILIVVTGIAKDLGAYSTVPKAARTPTAKATPRAHSTRHDIMHL